jgi:hypothetical protein
VAAAAAVPAPAAAPALTLVSGERAAGVPDLAAPDVAALAPETAALTPEAAALAAAEPAGPLARAEAQTATMAGVATH